MAPTSVTEGPPRQQSWIDAMKLPRSLGRAFRDQCLYSNFPSLWQQLLKYKLVKSTIDFSYLGQSKRHSVFTPALLYDALLSRFSVNPGGWYTMPFRSHSGSGCLPSLMIWFSILYRSHTFPRSIQVEKVALIIARRGESIPTSNGLYLNWPKVLFCCLRRGPDGGFLFLFVPGFSSFYLCYWLCYTVSLQSIAPRPMGSRVERIPIDFPRPLIPEVTELSYLSEKSWSSHVCSAYACNGKSICVYDISFGVGITPLVQCRLSF